jgi:predicted amidohydrolase
MARFCQHCAQKGFTDQGQIGLSAGNTRCSVLPPRCLSTCLHAQKQSLQAVNRLILAPIMRKLAAIIFTSRHAMTHTRYTALALQTACDAVNSCAAASDARALMQKSWTRIDGQIAASKAFIGSDVKLVVLPEYFLTGFPMGESITAWRDKACLRMDDSLYETMGKTAQRLDVHIAGNAYELDPNFPELYFQCSFLINNRGELALRYRRLVSMYAPTPHDVWQRYLEIYGLDKVFAVADTEIGRVAAIASEEILYPEIARCFAFHGAEIFLHCTSEAGSPLAMPKAVAKAARAYENMAYVVSANSAGIRGTPIPAQSTDGMSAIFDYKANKLCEAGFGESMVAHASIDLDALRAWRARPGMSNILSRQRTELFAQMYQQHPIYPIDSMIAAPENVTRAHFMAQQEVAIARLSNKST